MNVSDGASPIFDANPVAAALPDGSYAVAWGDFDGDGSDLGVALRRVQNDGALGPLRGANSSREFSQLNPDMVWTGTELVVAWEDYADAANGPDLHYRTFDESLNATSGDITLAASALPEAAVALAPFGSGWAAAYREGLVDGQENIVVHAAGAEFRVGPIMGGQLDDRPALVELDATHLLVAFSAATDPAATGTYNVPRARYAIVDVDGSATPPSVPLDAMDDLFTYDQRVSQLNVSAERGSGGVYLAWRSEARPGDAAGDQLWLKFLRWAPKVAGGPHVLETRDAEMLLPRSCEGNVGDQRRPALARVGLPPNGALAAAWDDYSKRQGSGEPEVVVHYAPLPSPDDPASPLLLTETWTAPAGSAWPARWTTSASGANGVVEVQSNKGEFRVGSGTSLGDAYVNDHTALNIDIVTTVRMWVSVTQAGAYARRADSDDDSWLGAHVSATTNDLWRIYAVIDGVSTNLAFMPMPSLFTLGGVGYEFQLRFRVNTAANGSVFLGMKYWHTGSPEPAAWLLQSTQDASSPVGTRFGTRAGRFGLRAGLNTTNRKVDYDHFRAVFFEGAQSGDLDLPPRPAEPLRRGLPLERSCMPGSTCGAGEGCCFDDLDCDPRLSCSRTQGEFQGVGSHALTCAPSHCSNLMRDADEVRADCGGADCAPCACTSSAAPGSAQYCTANCLCGQGESNCEYEECLPGLVCGVENARLFLGGNGTSGACAPAHCYDRIQDGNETAVDCGGSCGSNCTCDPTNGAHFHCRVFCPCQTGHGDCMLSDECAPGLVCGPSAGPKYGLGVNRACTPAHCDNNIFEPALGETTRDCGNECGCSGVCAGQPCP